jgi:MFS family permease
MAMAPQTSSPAGSGSGAGSGGADQPADLRIFVFVLFFVFGGITSLNDVLIPKLKELFTLNYTQAMLIQFCFFTAYLVVGIPGARLVKRLGYMRGAVAGLVVMLIGCLLFIPASQGAVYGLFLLALFVLASGVVLVQVVANPLISLLGPPQTAHSRLTFAQAFNSLGTTVFPYFGSILILGSLAAVGADQLRAPPSTNIGGRRARRSGRAISVWPSCWRSWPERCGCSATGCGTSVMRPARPWQASICSPARASAWVRCASSSMSAPKWRSAR